MHKLSPLRIAVADGSAFMRRLLAESLIVRGFEVAGVADSASAAVDLCRRARPDVLTFDITTPGMDGVQLMHELRAAGIDVPVILLCGVFRADAYRTVDVLAEGAVDFLEKPAACDTVQGFLSLLGQKIRLAAELHEQRRHAIELSSQRSVHALTPQPQPPSRRVPPREGQRAIVICASTGGVQALATLIPSLPPRVGAGTIVVQQLPEESFSAALADRLNRHAAIEVREAAGGEQLYAGTVLVAPGGSHLRLAGDRKVLVSTEAPIGGLRPRADLTIVDAARMFGESLLLVVLSGMGKDAVDGAAEVKRRGGRVLVESEASANAYGTPRAVIEAQLADDILMLDELAEAIVAEAGVWAPAGDQGGLVSAEQSYIQSLKAAGDTRRLRGL
ncbi:MAG: two-component system, chemotaxis family, protein-glutamate methylesterase/glutaminase, partial [Gaiellaceae bacterium]|nr:two-component system, chemotaxis family, protein-glutamate methylesterase/glutaminase [Gaiellaceae bacterium]